MPTTPLLNRLRGVLEDLATASGPDEISFVEKKIVGGTGFMWRGNLVCGEVGGDLLVRLGKEGGADVRLAKADAATTGGTQHPQVRRMIMAGRESKIWFVVPADEVRTKKPLRHWVERAVAVASVLPEQ
jgi:hypothetical protein